MYAQSDNFPDGTVLLNILLGAVGGDLSQPYDLSNLPTKMLEVERKYSISQFESEYKEKALAGFLAKFYGVLQNSEVCIEKSVTFVGIDQYYIIYSRQNQCVFRYRLGANRTPELTVKIQTENGSNVIRGEINLDVSSVHPERVRAFLAVICRIAESHQVFYIQQSGNIWLIKDIKGHLVEIVAYKVYRRFPIEKTGFFVEIEPRDVENVTAAMLIIEQYESLFELSGLVCNHSIAEMFCP